MKLTVCSFRIWVSKLEVYVMTFDGKCEIIFMWVKSFIGDFVKIVKGLKFMSSTEISLLEVIMSEYSV